MSKSSITVRDVFELPKPGEAEPKGWKNFGERVGEEVKGIKSAALPDVAEKVAELFEIPIPDIFLTSWRKAASIQALLDESRSSPETVMNTELGEHAINSVHRPHIEIRIQNKTVKKIEFTLKLAFNLKGFVLKIQNGAIRGMQTGECEVKGTLEYKDLVIAEKKLAPIILPGALSFDNSPTETQTETAEVKPTASITAQEPPTKIEERVDTKPADTAVMNSQNTSRTAEQGGALKEVAETKTQQVAPPVPLEASPSNAQDLKPLQPAEVAAQGVVGTVAEAEERTTWEVGEPEEDSATNPAATGDVLRDASSGATATAESPNDVIDRMSKELADRQRIGNETSEIADRAKAAG